MNNLRGISNSSPPPFFANNAPNFHILAQTLSFNKSSSNQPPGNNLFGSQTATFTREKVNEKNYTQITINDTLYELPEHTALELGDGLIENLGVAAEDLVQIDNVTKEEEALILEKVKEEYGFDDIKESFNKRKVPENIYFFNGSTNENFSCSVEFLGPDSDNREFAAFLLSDLGRQVMTSNKLPIHVDSGDIFYENHNTGENFYNFLMAQQNEDSAFIPRKFSYHNTFEVYISQFLQSVSIDDVKKYDVYAHKNANIYFIISMITLKLMVVKGKKLGIQEN